MSRKMGKARALSLEYAQRPNQGLDLQLLRYQFLRSEKNGHDVHLADEKFLKDPAISARKSDVEARGRRAVTLAGKAATVATKSRAT